MGECKYCGRNGWLLPISPLGVCYNCHPMVLMEVSQKSRIIIESEKIIQKSKNLDVQLSRCDLIVEYANALIKYEKCNIETVKPRPSELVSKYTNEKEYIILKGLQTRVIDDNQKVRVSQSPKSKINIYTKTLLKIMEYKGRMKNPSKLDVIESDVKMAIHQIQYVSYLEDAQKAEFKKQRKKALDKYYEALYFLQHDEIEDSLQHSYISFLESKIKELSGNENKTMED